MTMPDSPANEELIAGLTEDAAMLRSGSPPLMFVAARMEAAVSRLQALEAESGSAVKWIACVRDELVAAGYPSGDRTVALANLRDLTARLARLEGDFRAYYEFVERHTFPERAKANGPEAVYSVIHHHPAVKSLSTEPPVKP